MASPKSTADIIKRRIIWLQSWQANPEQLWPNDLASFHDQAILFVRLHSGQAVVCHSDVASALQLENAKKLSTERQFSASIYRCLQRMVANLLLFPWKPQLAIISGHSGFAVHRLHRLNGYGRLLRAMGYSLNEAGDFQLIGRPDCSCEQQLELQLLLIDLVVAELTLMKAPISSVFASSSASISGRTFAFGRGRTATTNYHLEPGCVGRKCKHCLKINSVKISSIGQGSTKDSQVCKNCGRCFSLADTDDSSVATYL